MRRQLDSSLKPFFGLHSLASHLLSVSPSSCFLGCLCVHCNIDSDSQVLKVPYVGALEYQERRNCTENYEIVRRQKHKNPYREVCVPKNIELLNESTNHKVQPCLEVSEETPVFIESVPGKCAHNITPHPHVRPR